MDLDRDSSGMTFLQYKLIYDHKRDCLKSLENIHRGDPYQFFKKMCNFRENILRPLLFVFSKIGVLINFPKFVQWHWKNIQRGDPCLFSENSKNGRKIIRDCLKSLENIHKLSVFQNFCNFRENILRPLPLFFSKIGVLINFSKFVQWHWQNIERKKRLSKIC